MFRWISGRLGRPIAGIISVLILVSILIPLAPPPAQAQDPAPTPPPATTPPATDTAAAPTGDIWTSLTKGLENTTQPIPIIVLDFDNQSTFRKGMVDRKMAAALSLAMQATGKFSVYPRQIVDSKMDDLSLSIPMNDDAQSMLADQLNAQYTVGGKLEHVTLKNSSDGKYAEVQVSALVVSRITRLPINGARVIARSSPKLAYDGNADALVEEAISTAGYQLAQRILDNRMPMASVVVTPPDGQYRLRGGSVIGIKSGMDMVCVRQESVTGILRTVSVTPTECTCRVIVDYKGIAPGDRVVPHFSLEITRNTEAIKRHWEEWGGTTVGIALLWALLGHASTTDKSPGSSVSAAPLADAATVTSINGQPYTNGGNLITWSNPSASASQDLGFIIYRTVAGQTYPITVVPASSTSYIDPGGPAPVAGTPVTTNGVTEIPEYVNASTTLYTYTITTDTLPVVLSVTAVPSAVVQFDTTQPLPVALETKVDTTAVAAVAVTALNLALVPGQVSTYQVQPIYWNYFTPANIQTTGGSVPPNSTAIFVGDISNPTNAVQLLPPPVISWPQAGAEMDGVFQCAKVNGGASYVLQISSSPTFNAANTVTVPATPSPSGSGLIEADYSIAQMLASPQLATAVTVYVRMGVQNAAPPYPVAEWYSYDNGYVFSVTNSYSLARAMISRSLTPTMPIMPGFLKASAGRPSNPGDGHRGNTGRISPW